jgi:uncharacterized membrane protein YidH (DUF202 family)
MTLGLTLALVTILAVAAHPPLGPALILVSALLSSGVERDTLVPVLRPHEVVLGLVAAGTVLHMLGAAFTQRRDADRESRPPVLGRLEVVLVLLAAAGSVLPLTWMVIRGRHITQDDVFYALQLWKYLAVFLIVRQSIRTPAQVRRVLWLVISVSAVVAVVGILQSLSLGGVRGLIASYHAAGDEVSDQATTRATATLGSSFSVGDVMVFSLAIAAGLLVNGSRQRLVLAGLSLLFVFGAFAASEFSALIGIVVAVFVFGFVTRTLGRTVLAFGAAAGAAAIALQPLIDARLSRFHTASGLPPSWSGRLENLNAFFLPEIKTDWNWLTGVRPAARINPPEQWRDWVYIESGHVWLLWTGGIVFAALFFVFLAIAMPRVLRVARSRTDAVGTAAAASFTALAVMAALMTLDPHLTLRGSAEVNFTLLALALGAGVPPPGSRSARTPARASASGAGGRRKSPARPLR